MRKQRQHVLTPIIRSISDMYISVTDAVVPDDLVRHD
jgi:hypothetical protein